MNTVLDANTSCFDNPAIYQIRVQGRIAANWSDRLDGMTIAVEQTEKKYPVTTLHGLLSDQAALAGILKTLYELHLSVLSVIRLDDIV